MSKVFLSYSHIDEEFVMGLPGRLKLNGVECFFDSESIAGGDNWVLELEKRLDECDFFVPILTPAYVHSDWCQKERTAFMASLHSGKSKKIIPLLLKDCGDLLPPFLKNIQHIDISAEVEFEKNYPKICRQLGGVYVEVEETIDRTKLPPLCPLPVKHRMPHRSLGEHFAGRVKDLWMIDEGLGRCNTAVVQGVGLVVGMGGLGKTQLAVEYVHRFGCYFPGGVFWVEAEMGRMTMTAQVAEAAGIKLDRSMDEKSQLAMLWQGLSKERTLIVLDNFPEGEEIQAWLPPEKSIYTLVTSRRKDFFNYFCHDLNKLDYGEALTLLNSGGRTFEMEEARPLIDALEGLPLALELVKHFLNLRPEMSIKELLGEMTALGQMGALEIFTEKYADQLPTGHSKQVAATFRMGWDLASDFEKQVLRAISLLAPAPVPRRVLRKILPATSESKLRDPLDEALSRLHAKLSLLELDGETDPRMHRLISAFMRSLMVENDPLQKNVITAIRDEMARVTDVKDTQSFRQLEKVLPHADYLLASEGIEPEQAIDIANYTGWHHDNLGRYRLGERYCRKALEIAEKNYKPGDPVIATQQSNLAIELRYLDELPEAHELSRMALKVTKKSFEPGHPTIAIRQSNLALVLQDLGKLEEARDLLREALNSDQKSYAPGHPTIAKRQSNLALVLKDIGEFEEARDLLQAALDAVKKSFSPGHPEIAKTQSNLAIVLRYLGELPEARDLLRAALEADQKSFGPGHPKIATRQSNLAMVLKDLGEPEEAKELLTLAYHSLLENLGPDNPKTKIAKGNLESVSG
ncbi:MAG: toll/interleukin-1 receptor domain-containing protein [Candidatus Aminicenantes bacterium]|nr:toll/interleukin-1 receptor domain-containing protein [Candidatus Aminicenantes bacterium]